jgi:hypothetical protein
MSNAGFECVAIADNLGAFTLADFAPATAAAMVEVLQRARIAEIVGVHDPMDLTPILDDAGTEDLLRLVLDDPGVDLGIAGLVPLTQAYNSLAKGEAHGEDVTRDGSIAHRMVRLFRASTKPWVAVVDAGPLYDPMVALMEAGGVPVFRAADRALRLLGRWAESVART